jgi:hypothetical protein
LEFVDLFNRHVLANERLYRTGTRNYMDMWLAAERLGDAHAYTREGRRARMIATIQTRRVGTRRLAGGVSGHLETRGLSEQYGTMGVALRNDIVHAKRVRSGACPLTDSGCSTHL